MSPELVWRVRLRVDVGVVGVLLDELAAGSHIFAHEHGEDIVGTGSILDAHLLQQTCLGVHGQMAAKYALQRGLPGIQGSCQWYARAVADDKGSYGTRLRTDIHRTPALQPEMSWIDKKAPKKPRKVKPVWTEDGYILFWTVASGSFIQPPR